MRKADYALLAQLLREKREEMEKAIKYSRHGVDPNQHLVASHVSQCAFDIAYDFARFASVNRAEFFKACGIE